MYVTVTLGSETRKVRLKKDMEILHGDGFEAQIDELLPTGDVIVSDSDGQYEYHKSELMIKPDEFYEGEIINGVISGIKEIHSTDDKPKDQMTYNQGTVDGECFDL